MAKTVLRNAAAIVAGLLLSALLAELFFRVVAATPLRWVLPEPQFAVYGPDAFTGYRHRVALTGMHLTEHRALMRTSNLGFRDRDRALAHGSGPRTVIIGNSIIEAPQVDERQTSVAVAERILAARYPGAEVVNLGLSAAMPAVEVARLESQALPLAPDLAIVVVDVGNFAPPKATTDLEYTGYRPDADGVLRLSYGFRETAGYRFRTSRAGAVFYWLLDHSEVVRILNDRKNVGVFAELMPAEEPLAEERPADCPAYAVDPYLILWTKGEPAGTRAVFDAFIRDLAAIDRDRHLPIIVATRSIEARCANLADKRAAAIAALRALVEGAGLQYVDLDARVVAAVGADGEAALYGFGAHRGVGHLNAEGNRVYGEIFADVIAHALRL
jgi:hypothetical protein